MKSALAANDTDQVFQSLAFGSEDTAAEPREPVIPPADVILLGRWAVTRLFDEVCVHEPLECAVKRRWPQPDLAIRAVENFLHDPVAMLILIRKRQEDMEPVRLEREKGLR